MAELARAASPNETGGILVGRRDGEAVEVLAVSDAGPKAVSSPVHFERDGAHCQAFLERTAAALGEGVDYVGEWHSHPFSSATPSSRDAASFAEIAQDAENFTNAPVLVIVAPHAEGFDWSFTVFPVDGLSRTIELEQTS
jgi:integrative and conjugative element protein (TIGR02256 family)